MKLSVAHQLGNIIKAGHFIDCNYLPTRLTHFTIDDEMDNVDIAGLKVRFPFKPYCCDLYHCDPQPIAKIAAHQRATYYRKFGYQSYIRRFYFKSFNRLQIAKAFKAYKKWNNFGN